MIVYQDRASCTATSCKHYDSCPLVATEKIQQQAKEAGLPLSLVESFQCFDRRDGE